MQRKDLEHLISAVCAITNQEGILVIGSQSVLGTYSEYELPSATTMSTEADVVPLEDDEAESLASLIDGTIGEMSPFDQVYGYYAQGVGKRTAILPSGWASRLVPLRSEQTKYHTGWCLEVHDLCSSKLMANRDKDRAFVRELINAELVSVGIISSRVDATVVDESRKAIARAWLAEQPQEQPNYREPATPHIPDDYAQQLSAVLATEYQAGAVRPPSGLPHGPFLPSRSIFPS